MTKGSIPSKSTRTDVYFGVTLPWHTAQFLEDDEPAYVEQVVKLDGASVLASQPCKRALLTLASKQEPRESTDAFDTTCLQRRWPQRCWLSVPLSISSGSCATRGTRWSGTSSLRVMGRKATVRLCLCFSRMRSKKAHVPNDADSSERWVEPLSLSVDAFRSS